MRFTVAFTAALAATAYAAPVASPASDSTDMAASALKESAGLVAPVALNEEDFEADDFESQDFEAGDIQARDFEAESSTIDSTELEESHGLEARQAGVIISILTPAATEVATKITQAAMTAAGNLIKAVTNWTNARETFTKTTVQNMYKQKPAGYVGAVCYNMGYKNSGGVSAIQKVKLTSSALHTDYDCFFTKKGNVFTAQGDGGFINLATVGCTYNSGKKTMTC